jgi:8-amino-7-oxononanoate synthase
VDIFIVTLSKAAGSAGGAVCGAQSVAEAITNFGRAYIYSTAIPPALAAASETAIDVMASEPQRQYRVRLLARQVRSALGSLGWSIPAGDSPIVPVIVGDEQRAMQLAANLVERGILAKAVRPPTVPKGSSRLRITLSAQHSDDEVERLIQALGRQI